MTAGSLAAFREQFAAFSKNGGGEGPGVPSWLPALRRRAFDRFTTLGFPTMRDENWHYTSVAPIAESAFTVARGAAALDAMTLAPWLIDERWSRLVFVNGQFARELSSFSELPAEVEITTLLDALAGDPAYVESQLAALATVDANAFAALNTAFVTDGVVVRVPADCVVEHPLHVVWATDANASNATTFPQIGRAHV